MKKTAIAISIISFCVMYFAWVFVVDAAPQIEFVGGTTFDFGDVQAKETLTHTFIFKNIGDQVLKIERVKGG